MIKIFRNNTRKPNHEAATCMLIEWQQIQGVYNQVTTQTKLRQSADTCQKVYSVQYKVNSIQHTVQRTQYTVYKSITFFRRSVTIQDSHEVRACNYIHYGEHHLLGVTPYKQRRFRSTYRLPLPLSPICFKHWAVCSTETSANFQ